MPDASTPFTSTTLPPFELERFFARYEFEVAVNLCASDAQTIKMRELIDGASGPLRAQWEALELGYSESLGHKQLRARIAALYDVDARDTLVFSGAQEAIYAWARATLHAGDHVVCVWPAYQSLYEVARAQGCDVTLVKLSCDNGWRYDVEAIARAVTPRTKAVVINTPHNPTGCQLSRAQLDDIVTIARRHDAVLVCDEVYRYLEHDARDTLPGAATLYERAISIGVLSKAFGLAGLRIGWVATRDARLLSAMAAYKDYTTICASAPCELLACMALEQRDRIVGATRAIVLDNLNHARAFFAAHRAQLAFVPPMAGCVAVAELCRDSRTTGSALDTSLDAVAFADHAAAHHGVLVLPGSVFGLARNTFRIGLGRANFTDGLVRLDAALHSWQHNFD